MNLSLRGSLAHDFIALRNDNTPERVQSFVDQLLDSSDDDLEKRIEGDTLVIGKISERGMFPPEW